MDQVMCQICAPSGAGKYQREIRQFLWNHRSEMETDLIIISGDKSFRVHQAVILPLSSHLTELLRPSCSCTKPAVCLPPSCSKPAVCLRPSCSCTKPAVCLPPSCSKPAVCLPPSCSKPAVCLPPSCSKPAVCLRPSCSCTKPAVCLPPFPCHVLTAAVEILYTGTTTRAAYQEDRIKVEEVFALLKIKADVDRDINIEEEPNDHLAIPENEQKINPTHEEIHRCYLNEVTGVMYNDERENVLVLDEPKNCKNHDEESYSSSSFKLIQSQGPAARARILNEVTGVFCYDENCKINNPENVKIVAEYDDVNFDNNENKSLKKHEYDITKYPKQAKRKNLTKLNTFGRGLDGNILSSLSNPQPENTKLKVTGLDNSMLASMMKSQTGNGKRKIRATSQSSKFTCCKCDYTSNRKENLKTHIVRVHKNILYKCNECDFTTTWKSTLKRHIDGVHKNMLYKCDECDYTTDKKENLKRHTDGVHKRILYTCNECDYTTTWEGSLIRHNDAIHEKTFYNCDKCDYKTKWKDNVKKHSESVHQEIYYDCNKCDFTTAYKQNLKNHIDAKHLKISYNCNQCDFTTKWKNTLKKHIHAAHQNVYFNCDQCEFKTMWKNSFKNHIDAHEKIYFKCHRCDFETAWKGNFKRHIEGAHKNISYNCNECNFTTTWKENIQRHIKGRHAGVSSSGYQRNPIAVHKPPVSSSKSVHGEVTANCSTRAQKISPDVTVAVSSCPGPSHDEAEQKIFQKKSTTKGDAAFLW